MGDKTAVESIRSMWGDCCQISDDISLTEIDNDDRDFTIVYIPANASEAMVEQKLHQKRGKALECMLDHCRTHFAKNGAITTKEQFDKYRSLIEQHAKGQALPEDMVAKMSQTTTVDMLVLSPNCPETNWVSVNAYVDDKGVAKNLEKNMRASGICRACGLSTTEVLGDAYIGMQFDNNDGFRRLDFTIKMLSIESWIGRAQKINSKRNLTSGDKVQQIMNLKPGSSQSAEKQGAIKRKSIVQDATKLKQAGNEFFGKGELDKAAESYTKCLKMLHLVANEKGELPVDAITNEAVSYATLSNRSACYTKMGKFQEALIDAENCIRLKPNWSKAHGRKAEALIGLHGWKEAKESLGNALRLNPAGPRLEIENLLKLVDEKLEQKAEGKAVE